MNIKPFAALVVAAGAAIGSVPTSAQAAYPDRSITWIVPFPPGGGADTSSRIVARKMETILGQSIVIQNQPGASGQIGTRAAARAAPDGYTLVMTASATLTLPGATGKTLPYDPVKDLTSIGTFISFPMALIGNLDLPPKTVQELIPYLRENAAKLAIGVPSMATIAHLSAEQFLATAGARTVIAHYQGDTAVLSDLVGGSTQLAVLSASSAATIIAAGKAHGYLVAGNERVRALPDVPTGNEAGLPKALLDAWYAISAPAGTSAEAIQTLNNALRIALADPQVQEDLYQRGFTPNYTSVAQFDQILAQEPQAWAQLIRTQNIKFE